VLLNNRQRETNLNPDFAVGFVMRSSKAIQKRLSGYFLSEEIVFYFEFKK
jgi:hypothetical protein